MVAGTVSCRALYKFWLFLGDRESLEGIKMTVAAGLSTE